MVGPDPARDTQSYLLALVVVGAVIALITVPRHVLCIVWTPLCCSRGASHRPAAAALQQE